MSKRRFVRFCSLLSAGVGLLALQSSLLAQASITYTGAGVEAYDNIFRAGGQNVSPSAADGNGEVPKSYGFDAGDWKVLTFSSVDGVASSDTNAFNTGGPGQNPSGPYGRDGAQDIHSYNGSSLSGIKDSNKRFYLVGVFTSGDVATGMAPATIDFSNRKSDEFFSPALNQIFYIGDGKTNPTANGLTKKFYVPSNANKLWLGFADAAGNTFSGTPGNYANNDGQMAVDFTIQTTPAPPGLLSLGIGLAVSGGAGWRSRRRKQKEL